jgi:hypothetical protein
MRGEKILRDERARALTVKEMGKSFAANKLYL